MKNFLLKTWLTMICLLFGVGTMWAEEYSFTIQTSDFNTTSYAANNGSHDFTATCTTDASKTMTVSCTSNQVMQSSSVMQWQKNTGYIYNTTDLGTIKSVTVNSSAGSFTTYYGTSEYPTSGTTVGNGYFTVKVGGATGKTSSIVVVFETSGSGTTPDPEPTTTYNVTIANSIANGKVTASTTSAAAGATVTLTATPATGYEFGSWNVTNASTSAAITVTDNKFTMPAANVNVSATFNAVQGGGEEPGGDSKTASFIFNTDAGLSALGITKPASNKGTSLGDKAYTSGPISMTATNGTTETRVWSSTPTTLRVYAGNSTTAPGTLTFSGTTIKQIVFTGTVPMTANVGTFNDKTWTGEATSVTFTATSGVTISTIDVTYEEGGETPGEHEKTLSSIAISGKPNKLTYKDGEIFDPTGLVVTGTYDDSTTGNLTAQASFNCTPSAMTLGTTSVSVTATVSEISSSSYNVNVTVNPNVDYVTLPWEWTGGGKDGLISNDGVTGYGLGSDYAESNAPYQVKLDGTGDYIMVKTNEDMGVCTIKVKMLGGATASTIDVQGSTNGTDFTKVETLTISGESNSILELSTSGNLGAGYRYVKFYFTKGSNVGVGGISIAKAVETDPAKEVSSISVTGTPEEFWKSDTFNYNGMTVTATYTDGSNEDVTSTAVFFGYDMATAGNQTVTVTYGGKTDTYNITVQTIANTQATAYTTTQAKDLIDAGKDLNTEVYVTGVVSKVDSYNESHKSITYWLDDNSFEVYGGLAAEGEEFTSVDDIEVGATVVVLGKITTYKGTYEVNSNNHLVNYVAPAAPTTGTFKIGSKGFGTYFTDQNYVMPEGVEGAVITEGVDEVSVTWLFTEGDVVEANTALLLRGEAGQTYKYEFTNEEGIDVSDSNQLIGTTVSKPAYQILYKSDATYNEAPANATYNFYKLSSSIDGTEYGWYWGAENGNSFTCAANKCVLWLTKSAANQSNLRALTLIGGDAPTSIEAIEAANANATIFDLQGRRVRNAQNGVYVVNGKKVIR